MASSLSPISANQPPIAESTHAPDDPQHQPEDSGETFKLDWDL
jgi:hypothetical protein